MVFTPDQPFPKTRGHVIRSKDWNDAVTEVQRLETAKVNKAGDAVTGPLTIAGNVGIGTTSPQRPLQIGGDLGGIGFGPSDASPNAGYVRWGDNTGWKLHFGRSRESSGGALNTGTTGVVMTLQDSGNVGIGTTTPGGKLEIGGGDLLLKAAGEDAGDIVFQASTGAQKGRIWSNPTPGAALFLSSGDVTPDIAIDASGNVGIGTMTPATGNKMDVAGNLRILTGSNPIRFTGAWSGFPDTATNQAEISNDTGTYKTLMIIGNRSAGLATPGGGRRVSVWDILEVNGILRMNADQDVLFRIGPDLNHGVGWYGPYGGGYGKAFAGSHDMNGPVVYGFGGGALGTTSGGQKVSLFWNSLGRVGINRFNPQFTLHVNGLAVRQDNSTQWTTSSDARLKQGVETLEGALGKLSRLRGVVFEWKKPEEHGNQAGTQMGLVAQEVEKVLPEWVDEGPDGHKTLTIRGFEAMVVEAFKELRAENEALKTKSKELEGRIEALERATSGRTGRAEDIAVVEATEAAERKARELGVRLSGVEGTGTGGRILVADVEKAAQG